MPESQIRSDTFLERWGWGAALVLAGVLVYSNCFQGEFVFDDNGGIVGNPHLQKLWPLSEALTAPPRTTTAGRPVICLSLALNYAFCGMEFWGYRVVNLSVHLLTGLLIFGVIRRTINGREKLRDWVGGNGSMLAFAVALLWVIHPLNTQVVNYIIQRSESLMAMFYMLTLYAAIRSWNVPDCRPCRIFWRCLAVLSCALGMGSKEVMVSAPFMVLLYDRIFESGGFLNALKRSKVLYAGLGLSLAVLVFLVARGGTANGARVGKLEWNALGYALSQCGVITHYLRLAFWPDPLVFDYAWPAAHSAGEIVPGLCVLLALAGGSVWALFRKPEIGFVGVWFFALLGPSSSVMPLPDLAVEYRMYLALPAVLLIAVVAVFAVTKRLSGARLGGVVVGALVVLLFGTLTYMRNIDYHGAIALWGDNSIKRPLNARSHVNLGIALAKVGKLKEALNEFMTGAQIDPNADSLDLNLGCLLAMLGRAREAVPYLERAVQLKPDDAMSHYNLANALSDAGRKAEAAVAYASALKLDPDSRDAHFNFGVDLQQAGKIEEAQMHFNEALRIDPNFGPAHVTLGALLAKAGKRDEAVRHLQAALAINPGDQNARVELGKLGN